MSKNAILAGIGALLLLTAGVFALKTIIFLSSAKKTEARVTDISSYSSTCRSGGNRKRSYPCTKYTAHLHFVADSGQGYDVTLAAGSSRSGSSTSSKYTQGSYVDVYYDPENPTNFCEDSFMGKWSAAAGLGVLGAIFSIASMFQFSMRGRQRYL